MNPHEGASIALAGPGGSLSAGTLRAAMLRWRGVEDPCEVCDGSGVRVYGSTATWRGGLGGAALTRDVCDACWGTGDKHRKGADLRALRRDEDLRVAERAARLLIERTGAGLKVCRAGLEELIRELERFEAQPRKKRLPWFREACGSLARVLREGLGP